jgi:hypothetical protein
MGGMSGQPFRSTRGERNGPRGPREHTRVLHHQGLVACRSFFEPVSSLSLTFSTHLCDLSASKARLQAFATSTLSYKNVQRPSQAFAPTLLARRL